MQTPSIGRIVHLSWSGQRIAAVITHVWSDTCINVQPFGNKAGTDEITSCVYEAESPESIAAGPNSMLTQHRSWAWPPRV